MVRTLTLVPPVLLSLISFVEALPPPPGGILTNNTVPPDYHPVGNNTGFDYQSLALVLHQEYIELDLFNYALVKFSDQEFDEYGIDAEGRELIRFMAQQEIGHAKLVSDMLGAGAPQPCNYTYNFQTVKEFVQFSQELTRWGESGVYGFLEHLDSRPSAQLLLQSITTEARQQLIFRQFDGLFPMTEWFMPSITQSMAWTLLAPYHTSCPGDNIHLEWQNFPGLNITNPPDLDNTGPPAITNNVTALTQPGRNVTFRWEAPGKTVGPFENGTYVTSTDANTTGDFFVAWVQALNTTFTPLTKTSNSTGFTIQPNLTVFPDIASPQIVNDTTFVAIVDAITPSLNITPFNFSLINSHIIAGPTVYTAG